MGTSPGAVPAKRSAQGEGREEEEEEEEAAGSSTKRRKREGSHTSGEGSAISVTSCSLHTHDVMPLTHLIITY